MRELAVTVNGRRVLEQVEDRLLLSDFLRHGLGLRGTHVGCEHGVCGACTVRLDGRAVRS
ncbi:MAG: 2-furoyl-CoA dehydrogenase 2Fe-2S iron sulfur subunit, partial [Gaiellales bacterium]|nr:2-furoyl-CoA dehydrogenase 2Fe-2S iron sulfur subunit [Gaiellales bacterium]